MTITELYKKADELADKMKLEIAAFEKEYGEDKDAPFRLRMIYIPEQDTWRFTIHPASEKYPFLYALPVWE